MYSLAKSKYFTPEILMDLWFLDKKPNNMDHALEGILRFQRRILPVLPPMILPRIGTGFWQDFRKNMG